jgi:hypothetical protein
MKTLTTTLLVPLLFSLQLFNAADVIPKVRVYINNHEINYQQLSYEIRRGDTIRFIAMNTADNGKLRIGGYKVRYFNITINDSKIQRQKPVGPPKFVESRTITSGLTISISVNDLLKSNDFNKIDIELGQLSMLSGTKRTIIPLHSSKRTFTFMLL